MKILQVRDVIIPIFSHEDLASDDLLSKCLHGQTQNVNEFFNQCIWKKIPKETFVGKQTLQMASATMHFNDGTRGLLNLFEKCSIEPGHFTVMGCAKYDALRVARMNTKGSTSSKKQRKRLRAQLKGWEDKNDIEKSYNTGNFRYAKSNNYAASAYLMWN